MLGNFKIFLIVVFLLSNSIVNAENADKDKPVFLESDSAKWDEETQKSTYRGNVVVTQGTMLLTGNLLIVRTGLASWTRCLRTAAGHWSEPRANDVSSL